MARIQSNPRKLGLIAAVLLLFLLISGAVAFVMFRKPDEFAKLPAFPIDTYMKGKDLWSHEDYRVEGRVDNVLMRSPGGDKLLVAIQPDGSDLRIPVLMQTTGGAVPIQREQRLVLRVNLGRASEIQCTRYEPR